jgi:iron complex outermembrane receptor protein
LQNSYTASPDPNIAMATQYSQGGETATKGFEGETNIYLYKGLSLYANGSVGAAHFVSQTIDGAVNPNYQRWVANAPANTAGFGLTYRQRYLDFGIFNKRSGPMWNDGTNATGATANQYAPINPFNVTNLFFNFTMRRGSFLDQSKLRLSFNNLFDQKNIVSVSNGVNANVFTPNGTDLLGLLPGRNVALSFVIGLSPRAR